jgi:hypothetical protein
MCSRRRGRVVGIVALKNYLALDCELRSIDLGPGDQRAPEYVSIRRLASEFEQLARAAHPDIHLRTGSVTQSAPDAPPISDHGVDCLMLYAK